MRAFLFVHVHSLNLHAVAVRTFALFGNQIEYRRECLDYRGGEGLECTCTYYVHTWAMR